MRSDIIIQPIKNSDNKFSSKRIAGFISLFFTMILITYILLQPHIYQEVKPNLSTLETIIISLLTFTATCFAASTVETNILTNRDRRPRYNPNDLPNKY